MSYEPGDNVTYESNQKAVVCTVHGDGMLNIVAGSDYSDASAGPWPMSAHERVDPDAVEDGWPGELVADPDDATDDDVESAVEDADVDAYDVADGFADDEGTVDVDFDPDTNDVEADVEFGGDFDADVFVDRTPMSDVVDDIEAGEVDGNLDAVEEAEAHGRDRVGVADAIASRREELED